jgi:hypothetical protein
MIKLLRASSYQNVDNLFILGKWPRLRLLRLNNIGISPTHSMRVALESFFSTNLAIRRLVCLLHIDNGKIPTVNLPPNCLPHLTFLLADDWMVKAILSCPCSPSRSLERFQGLALDKAFWE